MAAVAQRAALKEVFQQLEDEALEYLEGALTEAGAEDRVELLDLYCDDLNVSEDMRRKVLDTFTACVAEPTAAETSCALLQVPARPLCELLPESESMAVPIDSRMHAVEVVQPKARAREPAWLDGRMNEVSEQLPLPHWALSLFQGAWTRELDPWPQRLSTTQLAKVAEAQGGKHGPRLAAVLARSDVDGSLCMAGGIDTLQHELARCGVRGAALEVCKVAARELLALLKRENVSYENYHEVLYRLEDIQMMQSFQGCAVEPWLHRALRPAQPRYLKESARDHGVRGMHEHLQQQWGSPPQPSLEPARVVSITEAHGRVRQNLIYINDAGGWQLVASVDFVRHGDSPSGHWHLNRTPAGDVVEHWGPLGQVYHGTCFGCPLWWLVIPAGLCYCERPTRLDLLPEDAFGSMS
mmetsp:Transcript_100/g.272  ORF Transcript_100/g.272 Transcript_100/m.272 type:complete len:411 (+) Transcript_100:33-1265(+)